MSKLSKKHYSYSLYADKKFASDYEQDRFGKGFGTFLKSYEIELYTKLLPKFDRMLDVGAGTGKIAAKFAKRGRVVASDASFEMLKNARDLAKEDHIYFDVVVCDAHHLCFKDEAFDAVVSSRVLMHVIDWKLMIKELCRVSSNAVCLDFPAYWSFSLFERIMRKLARILIPRVQSYRGFASKTVAQEFIELDFDPTVKLKSFFLPVAVYRLVNAPRMTFKLERFWGKLGFTRFFGNPVTYRFDKKVGDA